MNEYRVTFRGRLRNAIGIFRTITDSVQADNTEDARLKLYDKYEHIQCAVFEVKTKNGYKRIR